MTFNVLNQFNPYNETTITGRHGSSNVVALQCVCRCGLRIAFVAFECRRMSSLCSARAAVGCVVPCRIPMPQNVVSLQRARRCGLCVAFVASATPWPQLEFSLKVQVLGTVGADGGSSANPPTPNAELQDGVQAVLLGTLQSYYYQDGFLQQQDTGYPSAGETRLAVGPNHASVTTLRPALVVEFNMNW